MGGEPPRRKGSGSVMESWIGKAGVGTIIDLRVLLALLCSSLACLLLDRKEHFDWYCTLLSGVVVGLIFTVALESTTQLLASAVGSIPTEEAIWISLQVIFICTTPPALMFIQRKIRDRN